MSTQRKLKVGLALGSGAARGWAHIGVIRELEKRGITIDIVTGSSVGAVVGGAFAAGQLDDFEQWISGLERFDIIRLLDARMSGGGFLQGKSLMDAIEKRIGNPAIDALDMPFACVATELGTGREIWLRDGSLLDGVRASIALPGVFAPTKLNSDYLLDGGLVNPVPVSLARAMGADLVIAVNLNGDLVGEHFWVRKQGDESDSDEDFEAEVEKQLQKSGNSTFSKWVAKLKAGLGIRLDAYISSLRSKETPEPGLFDVLVGSIDIMQDRITRSRMAGEPPDVHITPRLSHIGLMDFDRAEEAIKEGRKAVDRESAELDMLQKRLGA